MRTDFIFYAIAIVCFIGFLACLAWYYMERRKPKNTKAPLNWTIESAKKFLEENDKSQKAQSDNKKTEKVIIIDKEKFKEVKTKQTNTQTNNTNFTKQTNNHKTTTSQVKKPTISSTEKEQK